MIKILFDLIPQTLTTCPGEKMTLDDAKMLGYTISQTENGYYLSNNFNSVPVYRGNNGWGTETEELIPYSSEIDAWNAVVGV